MCLCQTVFFLFYVYFCFPLYRTYFHIPCYPPFSSRVTSSLTDDRTKLYFFESSFTPRGAYFVVCRSGVPLISISVRLKIRTFTASARYDGELRSVKANLSTILTAVDKSDVVVRNTDERFSNFEIISHLLLHRYGVV